MITNKSYPRKEERNGQWGLRHFQQFNSYHDEIEHPESGRNYLLFTNSSKGSSVAGGPQTALRNAAHLYSDQAKVNSHQSWSIPSMFFCQFMLFHVFLKRNAQMRNQGLLHKS